uniref:Photosystem I PsaJ n=1 Tax=Amphidinium carterae TaxID=2961 RepID=UPI002FE4FAEA
RKIPAGPYSVSVEPLRDGATNEVSIVTPPISSEGVQEYLSLAPVFFMALAIFTSGFAIEVLRFFPDTRYW